MGKKISLKETEVYEKWNIADGLEKIANKL